MLFRIAWGNVRRARRDYLVYLLTLVLGVTVFYAFNTIAQQMDYAGVNQDVAHLLSAAISGLTVFLAMVMGFLMVYANNFLMRRRKREFGLLQVLGMGRGQVAGVMTLETAIVSATAFAAGIALGAALSQLMTFFTASLFRTQIAHFHFFFSWGAFWLTAACLAGIFVLTLLFNLRAVARSKVIDLMGASRANEAVHVRNPWVSSALFVAGVGLVAWAYARLLHDGMPINRSVSGAGFAITTGLVIAGTFLLFYGLSGFLLKVLHAVPGIWWRGLDMFTLRQLSAKVNTVSVSMGVISLILFLAVTSVTFGMSMVTTMTAGIDQRTPADFTSSIVYQQPTMLAGGSEGEDEGLYITTGAGGGDVSASMGPTDDVQDPQTAGDGRASGGTVDGVGNQPVATSVTEPVDVMGQMDAAAGNSGSDTLASAFGAHIQVDVYRAPTADDGLPELSLKRLSDLSGVTVPDSLAAATKESTMPLVSLMSVKDFNRYLEFRGMPAVDLGSGGYLITSNVGDEMTNFLDDVLDRGTALTLCGRELRPREGRVDASKSSLSDTTVGMNMGTVIVPDDLVAGRGLSLMESYLLADYPSGTAAAQGDERVKQLVGKLNDATTETYAHDGEGRTVGLLDSWATKTDTYAQSYSMNGLVSYLAIYIGFVLVVACGAILAIQQLSGVADAEPSYRLLSELGCDERQIRRSLLAQQGVFFALPLIVGIAHSCVALRVLLGLVKIFGHLSFVGTAGVAIVIFVAAYGGYFLVTYLMGVGMVHEAVRTRKSE